MLSPLIRRPRNNVESRATVLRSAKLPSSERGFTMALVAVSMVAIIAMAALSIDIGTLYEAKAEAQRSADAAALTAARVISISGITGDPGNLASSWPPACGGATSLATLAAIKVAQQNLIGGVSVPSGSVTVTYGAGTAGGSSPTCVGVPNFGVNPIVTVSVQRTNLPIFFARVFSLVGSKLSTASVSATASAEAYNSSASGTVAPGMIPVNPRCVKPWIVPNIDPAHSPSNFVSPTDGSISLLSQGISERNNGAIGESFDLGADCAAGGAANCNMPNNPPSWTAPPPPGPPPANILEYVPALVPVGTNVGAAPSCPAGNPFQKAIVGCDQTTVYACGTLNGAQVDLTENPVNPSGAAGDTGTAVACLTNAAPTYGGADVLSPLIYPFEIHAGGGNPLVQKGLVNNDDLITASNSIVTIPIYDTSSGGMLVPPYPLVTIVGFLQVFINGVDVKGNINVTVLNVAGCSNTAAGNPTVAGTSPVPVRLITPP